MSLYEEEYEEHLENLNELINQEINKHYEPYFIGGLERAKEIIKDYFEQLIN
jgi:hypothetical protein